MIIDLHSHILPGVDDGAKGFDEAIEMIYMAAENDTGVLVATPHANQRGIFENYADFRLGEIFDRLKYETERRRIPVRLLAGMEIYASDDVVSLIRRRMLIPMAGTQYYLIEFPFSASVLRIEKTLAEMLESGFIPLIAHPERYYCVQEEYDLLRRWRKMGCYTQMNKGSVFNRFGEISGKTAREILKLGLVDVLGSDAHGARQRTTEMKSVREYIISRYSEDYADLIMRKNPEGLLKGERLRCKFS